MMNRTHGLIALIFATMFALAGCRGGTEIRDVNGAPITGNPSMDQIQDAIIRAGANRGWRMTPQGEGNILGVLEVRSHVARVNIRYNRSSYSINFLNAVNLDHDPAKGTIHNNYNGWIQNLETEIHNELALVR